MGAALLAVVVVWWVLYVSLLEPAARSEASQPEIAGEYLLHGLVDPAPRAWHALAGHLTAAPSGPVAQALDNPLTLSLLRQVYKFPDPVDELLDTTRFPTLAEIEDHLLGRLVMVAYTPRDRQPAPRYSVEVAHRTLRHIATWLTQAGTRDLRWWRVDRLPHHAPRSTALRIVARLALAFGLVTPLSGQPSRRPSPDWRNLLSLRTLTVGVGFGIVSGLAAGLTDKLPVGLAAAGGFAVGLAFTVVADHDQATVELSFLDPMRTWRRDWNVLLTSVLTGTLLSALFMGLLAGIASGPQWLGLGALLGFLFGLVFGPQMADVASVTTALTFAQLAAAHGTPLRLMSFLEDARRRHILRTVGPVYQFRHAKLQDHLARHPHTSMDGNLRD